MSSILSTGASDSETPKAGGRSSDTAPLNRVRSLAETAKIAGISLPTLRRRLADGSGPKLTRMSTRRVGVTDNHRDEWLDACAVDPEAS